MNEVARSSGLDAANVFLSVSVNWMSDQLEDFDQHLHVRAILP